MHLWAQHAAAYGKMETFEVSLMRCIYKGKQFSWLLALSVPPGIAGFILHTPYSFLWGIIGFILCGLIGPFLYYFVKREDLGDAEGPYHSAAHLAAWSAAVCILSRDSLVFSRSISENMGKRNDFCGIVDSRDGGRCLFIHAVGRCTCPCLYFFAEKE